MNAEAHSTQHLWGYYWAALQTAVPRKERPPKRQIAFRALPRTGWELIFPFQFWTFLGLLAFTRLWSLKNPLRSRIHASIELMLLGLRVRRLVHPITIWGANTNHAHASRSLGRVKNPSLENFPYVSELRLSFRCSAHNASSLGTKVWFGSLLKRSPVLRMASMYLSLFRSNAFWGWERNNVQ